MLGLKVAGGRMTGKYILTGKRKQARKRGLKERSREEGRIQRNERRKEWIISQRTRPRTLGKIRYKKGCPELNEKKTNKEVTATTSWKKVWAPMHRKEEFLKGRSNHRFKGNKI